MADITNRAQLEQQVTARLLEASLESGISAATLAELNVWCLERGLEVQLLRAPGTPTTIRFHRGPKVAKVLFAEPGAEELALRALLDRGLW